MEPPAPRSGEDLSRAFRGLPPGTLSGLDALCDYAYWLSVMKEAEIEISNEDIFRFRFAEISKTASNRLAFLAGSGEYGTFNLRYLIRQLVEQCSDMHKYTRKLEKYVVKLQQRVESLEAERGPGGQRGDTVALAAAAQQQHQRQELYDGEDGGGGAVPSGNAGGSGSGGAANGASSGYQRGAALASQLHALLPPPQPLSALAAAAAAGQQQYGLSLLTAPGPQLPQKRARPQDSGPGAGAGPGEASGPGQEDGA